MEQKRPLVWLSADSRQDTTGLPVEKHWQATFVNAASPTGSRWRPTAPRPTRKLSAPVFP